MEDRSAPLWPEQSAETRASGFRWIPIRSLSTRHKPRIAAHLLTLDARDRYLRFGWNASDTQIVRYVDGMNFERDEIYGVFNRRLELVAMAHLAFAGALDAEPCAEFGVSVLPTQRGRGMGARLYDHACMHARSRGVDTLVIHALTENSAMLAIARRHGASVVHEGGEALAKLRLPAPRLATHMEALLQSHAANADFGLKAQAFQVGVWVQALAEVREGVMATGQMAAE